MTKGYELPQTVKDDGGAQNPVHVKLANILECRNSPLIVLKDVGLIRECATCQNWRSRSRTIRLTSISPFTSSSA